MSGLVVFDLDGTLVDTPGTIVKTFTAAFTALSVAAHDPIAIRATIGLPLEQAFASLLGVAPDDPQVILGVDHYQRFFRELVLPNARKLLFPGVPEGLSELDGAGIALAVATSKFHRSADALLTAAGIREHFDIVVGADDVRRPKPDPECVERVLAALGVPAADAVMVGDSTHDLLSAHGAGVRTIALTYGVHDLRQLTSAEPTWVADSFTEVLEHVRSAIPAPCGDGVQP